MSVATNSMPTVLLVEDNEMNRDMLSRRLVRLGYRVVFAGDSKTVLETVDRERPDIILMDLRLPDLSGWETTQQLKSNPHFKDIPVIALTAHAMEGDRERAMDAGCDDYDTKPVDITRLNKKICVLLKIR